MGDKRHEGEVDFFNDTGGYGFIESNTVSEDVFFHMEDIGGPDLTVGTKVTFQVESADKGPRAKEVVRKPVESSTSKNAPASNSTERDRHYGTVDFFNDIGKYGFIETDTIEGDPFFHMEDIGGEDLVEGTNVSFEVEYADKGPKAIAVQRTDSEVQDDQPENTEVFDPHSEQAGSDGDTEVFEPDSGGVGSDESGNELSSPAYCPYCGADLSNYPDASFCSNCGEGL